MNHDHLSTLRVASRHGPAVALLLLLAFSVSGCGSARPTPAPSPVPTWRPDTATVLYTSRRGGDADVWLQHGVNGEPVDLSRNDEPDIGAEFGHDNATVWFQTILPDGNRDIFSRSLGEDRSRNVTRHPAHDLLGRPSPDGRHLLFFSTRGEEPAPDEPFPGNLWTLDLQSGEMKRVTQPRLGSSFGGAWSPDGARVVFARFVAPESADLFERDMISGDERRLTALPGSEYGARYSPDGSRLAFHHQVGDTARIAVLDLGTGVVHAVTGGGLHYYPAWSPDGRWILYTAAPLGGSQYDLLAVEVETGRRLDIVTTDADERHGVWALPPAATADAYDPSPRFGVWQMETDRPAPYRNVMTYEPWGAGGMRVTVETTNGEGRTSAWGYVTLFDGTFRPVDGQDEADTAVEVVNERTTRITNRRGGRVTQVIINTLAEDGQTISNEYVRLDAAGKITGVGHAVYRRVR